MNYFMCIDLKTFFASVECVERGLDPFKTDLLTNLYDPDAIKEINEKYFSSCPIILENL